MASMVKPWHIIVLVVILILLFGAKRLPGRRPVAGPLVAHHQGRDPLPRR